MSCCTACQTGNGGCSGGLGFSTIPEPRRLTEDEVQVFLIQHSDDQQLQLYLNTCDPQWGIIVNSFGEDMLVYRPVTVRYQGPNEYLECGEKIYVINVHGHPIVESVRKAPFVSPDDSGFWNNFVGELNRIIPSSGQIESLAAMATTLVVLYGAWQILAPKSA